MPKKPLVALICLNWKTSDLTKTTVNSLLKIHHKNFNFHIFLLDNGSPDNSMEVLSREYSGTPLITLEETGSNLGFGIGNNYGINLAQKLNPDYYMLINSDVTVDPDFLDNLIDYSNKHPQYQLLGPKIYFAPGYEYHQDRYSKKEIGHVIWFVGAKMDWDNINGYHPGVDEIDHGQFEEPNDQIDYLTGCCLLIKSEVIKKIGVLDPKYFMYLEDADYSQRALKAGFKIIMVPQSKIWHYNSGSSSVGSPLQDYFLTRNRLLFGFRYARWRIKLALFKHSLKIFLNSPSKWQKQGVLDYYLGKFDKGSWK